MESISPNKFFEIQSSFDCVPFSQSKGWFEYLKAKGENLVFYIDNLHQPSIGIMGRVKSIIGYFKILLVEGEVLKRTVSSKVIKDFYYNITKLHYFGIEINSNNRYQVEFEIGIRRAGFVRPLGGCSCPLTMLVDLTQPLRYDNDWKRNYKKAVKNEHRFQEIVHPEVSTINQITALFSDMMSKKGLGRNLDPSSLLVLTSKKDMGLFILKDSDNNIISWRIVYVNGFFSTDVFAANSRSDNSIGASRLIVQSILERLAKSGVRYFDFGRISPSNNTTDFIYQFKAGIRGEIIQYNGEWTYYKSNIMEFIIHFAKFFFLRLQRY